jgi:hypothetical protein
VLRRQTVILLITSLGRWLGPAYGKHLDLRPNLDRLDAGI